MYPRIGIRKIHCRGRLLCLTILTYCFRMMRSATSSNEIPRSFLSFLFLSSSHRKSTIEYMTLYIQCQSMEQPRLRHKTGQTKNSAKIRWCKLRSKYLCHRKEKFSSNLGCLLFSADVDYERPFSYFALPCYHLISLRASGSRQKS